jgi:hypothetical protein
LRYRQIAVIILVLIFSSGVLSFAGTVAFTLDCGGFNSLPEPRLRYPISETAILTGSDPLEFQWWNDVVGIRGFTIKIYKGYNMYAGDLIYKEDLPQDASSVKVDPGLFEDGQVYTWSLIRISYTGYKSDRSFNSFKVVKE